MAKITLSEAESAVASDGIKKISDGGGLFLHVRPSGTKTWNFSYRIFGKQKTVGLGRFPCVSIQQARRKHALCRFLLSEGHDPSAIPEAQWESVSLGYGENVRSASFEDVARQWQAKWAAQQSEDHARSVLARLETDVFPLIGSLGLHALRASDLLKVIYSIEGRGAVTAARRTLGICQRILSYAVANDYVDKNVANDLKRSEVLAPEIPQEPLARVSLHELPELLRDIERCSNRQVRLALNLLALTFVRVEELVGATWDEIDFKHEIWRIPSHRMKGKREHLVPLSNQASQAFRTLFERRSTPWVFPSGAGRVKPMSANDPLYALYSLGYKGKMTCHGFRALASTLLHEVGFEHFHIEKQLAHTVRDPYNHANYMKQRANMVQAWANFLDEARKTRVADDASVIQLMREAAQPFLNEKQAA